MQTARCKFKQFDKCEPGVMQLASCLCLHALSKLHLVWLTIIVPRGKSAVLKSWCMWWINDWHQLCMWSIWCDWQLAPMLCADCGKNFCVSHRLPEVHACARDVIKTKPATLSPFLVVANSPPQPLPSHSKPVTPWARASQLQLQQPKGQVTLTLSLTLDFITQNTSNF